MQSLLASQGIDFSDMPGNGFSWESCAISDTETDCSDDEGPAPSRSCSLSLEKARDHVELATKPSRCSQPTDKTMPHNYSAANLAPPEILLEIFSMLSPQDFDNARRTCSQWMRISLNKPLLEYMLKRAGWWDTWQQDCQTNNPSHSTEDSLVWKMSRRFATECLLSGRKTNIEKRGFLATSVVDFSRLANTRRVSKPRKSSSHHSASVFKKRELASMSKFNVSSCGNYLLVTTGCTIFVYRLLNRKLARSRKVSLEDMADIDIAPVTTIPCSSEVLTAVMDTSTPKFVVAALLRGRIGVICDVSMDDGAANNLSDASGKSSPNLDDPTSNGQKNTDPLCNEMRGCEPVSPQYYYDICSPEDPPRNVSICPGRRDLTFPSKSTRDPNGNASHIITRWPWNAWLQVPYENRGNDRPPCQIHLLTDVQQSFTQYAPENTRRPSVVRATHCHHYRAVPINDGMHILFIEPRTGLLCIGSDAPIGGPTSLTRALLCIPPFMRDSSDSTKAGLAPTVFAAGSDLSWGLRVVAAYGDRIILYSVPLDVFNVIKKEHERQGDSVMGDSDLARDLFLEGERTTKRRESTVPNQNGDWEFLLSVSYRPTTMMWPFKIYGKEIGKMDDVVELALQSSHGGARVWAFGASGSTKLFDVDTFTSPDVSPADVPCKSLAIEPDGSVLSTGLINRPGLQATESRKRKQYQSPINFGGQYPITHQLHNAMLNGGDPSPAASQASMVVAEKRRASFAACIVDFKVPELGNRTGRWMD
ncbi:F-box domain protein [Aspergillus sclerotialis]|uniref:F-box domain protein n=1 Tax=Aspergillus sclerotialis TaxID=2070753 RepID=A0A3A2ZPB8_9EURO|nr:F-box domain protein [Aspergillus sclerotialis]